jgi:hypothetical protein
MGKMLVRQDLYKKAAESWGPTGKPGGLAITLAGEEAKEIPLLRDFLSWDRSQVMFVDTDNTGLKVVQRKWEGAGTYHGMLHEMLATSPPIGFLNMDFMGLFNDEVEAACAAARGKLLPGAIVAYTFIRCRDSPKNGVALRPRHAAKEILTRAQMRDKDLVRWVGYSVLLQQKLGMKRVEPLVISAYQSTTPMGVIALKNG